MKPTGSEITTNPAPVASPIGMLHGAHGSATPASSRSKEPLSVERAESGLELLKRLLPSLSDDLEARETVARSVEALSVPANGAWLMARVAALLSPYYEKDIPQGVRQMEAEDWAVALDEFPEWAVTKAVRWWKSADNERRHVRPVEGDIQGRCRVEMSTVRAARKYLDAPHLTAHLRQSSEPPRPQVSPEDMAHRAAVAADMLSRFRVRPTNPEDDAA